MKRVLVTLLIIISLIIEWDTAFSKNVDYSIKRPLIVNINVRIKIPPKMGLFIGNEVQVFSNLKNFKVHSEEFIKDSNIFKRFWIE